MAERDDDAAISRGASDGVCFGVGFLALLGQVVINALDHGDFGFPRRAALVVVVLVLMPLIGMAWVPLLRRAWRGRGSWDYYAAGAGLGVMTSVCVCFGVLSVFAWLGWV